MVVCVLGLTYTAFTRDNSLSWHSNVLTGLVGVFIFIARPLHQQLPP